MGNWISSILSTIANYNKKDMRILMVGLDNAGKTSMLYKLKLGEVVETIPTIGFNVESIRHKNIDFTVWDVGSQHITRTLWRHYFENTHAIIFVVDSNDPQRFEEAREELHTIIDDSMLSNTALLVFANKQDLPNAAGTDVIAENLALPDMKSRQWSILPCCATNGNGVCEGFDWLSDTLNNVK